MAQGDLDTALLLKIMQTLGESRGTVVGLDDLFELFRERGEPPLPLGARPPALVHLERHVTFLRDIGLLTIKKAGFYQLLDLTAKGQMFVQPELAEFGQQPILPQVVKSFEDQIQVLTYPQEEKDGMVYRLREAIAKQAPEVIVKVISEIGFKILKGGA